MLFSLLRDSLLGIPVALLSTGPARAFSTKIDRIPGTHLGNPCVYRVETLVKLAIFESDNGFVGV